MELTELLTIVAKTFDRIGISYLVTGSVASISYGEPRLTNDIDQDSSAINRDNPTNITVRRS